MSAFAIAGGEGGDDRQQLLDLVLLRTNGLGQGLVGRDELLEGIIFF